MIKQNNNSNPVLFTGLNLGELKEFFTEILEEQLGRKLAPGSRYFVNGIDVDAYGQKVKTLKDLTIYLTRGEVSKQLQISLPTLHSYVKQGLIKSYRIGGKIRFKLTDIEQALTERNFTAVNRKGGSRAA